jgi:hypothetical protein
MPTPRIATNAERATAVKVFAANYGLDDLKYLTNSAKRTVNNSVRRLCRLNELFRRSRARTLMLPASVIRRSYDQETSDDPTLEVVIGQLPMMDDPDADLDVVEVETLYEPPFDWGHGVLEPDFSDEELTPEPIHPAVRQSNAKMDKTKHRRRTLLIATIAMLIVVIVWLYFAQYALGNQGWADSWWVPITVGIGIGAIADLCIVDARK